jgi:hypothetical protein
MQFVKYSHSSKNYSLFFDCKWEITVLYEKVVYQVNILINLGDTTECVKEIFSYIDFLIRLFKHALTKFNVHTVHY